MADYQSETGYRLKLRERDVIQATVTKVGTDEVQADTSLWSNIGSAKIVKTNSNTSIAPSTKIYATVTDISEDTATLTQKRGVYRRNHLPGDSLRMQAIEQVSSSVCRATIDQFRNLETVYLVGVSLGADVTTTLAKIRDGTAFALPATVHNQGLVVGRTFQVRTTAGSTRAAVTAESLADDIDQHESREFRIELAEPAWTTGLATAEITATDADQPEAIISEYPTELPQSGDQLKTGVKEGSNHTKISLGETDVEITVQLRQDSPARGTVTVDLLERADGFYEGELVEYIYPPVQVGQTHDARVYESRNKAKIEFDSRDIRVAMRDDIHTTGETSIKIVDISDAIYGRLDSDITPLSGREEKTSDIDITDVSKF